MFMPLKIALILVVIVFGLALFAFRGRFQQPANLIGTKTMSFYELSVGGLEGGTIHMKDFKGKYVLCVNVASKCGYTPQYKPLEELAQQYKDKLVVIGFPCNQFFAQEPGSSEDIAGFCQRNYGVTFPMSQKLDVKGKNQHPVYQWLTRKELNGSGNAEVSWNFNKFLISPTGEWLAHFESKVDPLSAEITSRIK
jgi:glutathione peroxidase